MATVGMGLLERAVERSFGERRRAAELRHIEQIPVYDRHWRARSRDGSVRYVALGDSLAQGIGLDDPEHGYVASLERVIEEAAGESVATHNLSISGARTEEVLERQLPLLDDIAPHVVTLSIGGNDVTQPEWDRNGFAARMARILEQVPVGTVVSDVPTLGFGPYERRAREAGRVIRGLSAERGLPVAGVYRATRRFVPFGVLRRMSDDLFHPNALGQQAWTDTFAPLVAQRARAAASVRV